MRVRKKFPDYLVVREFVLPLYGSFIQTMQYQYNDGGRAYYGAESNNHDCVVRAIAIATGQSYPTVYQALVGIAPKLDKEGVNIYDPRFIDYMTAQGFVRVDGVTTMQDIPAGCVIASTTGHYTAIINGVIQDVRNESAKAVPHYWVKGRRFRLQRNGVTLGASSMNYAQAITMRRTLMRTAPDKGYIHLIPA